MEKKVLSLLLVFVMVFLFIPVIPVTVAQAAPAATATSGVTFKTDSNVNLRNPTDLVLKTDDYEILANEGYNFDSIYISYVPSGKGYNLGDAGGLITYANGVLTLPAALFGMHQGSPLQAGTYKADITFNHNTLESVVYSVYFTMTNTAASGSSGSSGSGETAATVESLWLERDEAQRLASKAKAQSDQSVRTARTGTYGVRGNAWDRLTGLCYYHDTKIVSELQVRLYIDEPSKMKKDALVSAYVSDGWAQITKSKFEKYFINKVQVVHFDQQADWEQSVRVAAKLNFTGMDTKSLHFYAYDKETNTYRRIDQQAYRIDKNGYLHFKTPFAGDIIISENSLERK